MSLRLQGMSLVAAAAVLTAPAVGAAAPVPSASRPAADAAGCHSVKVGGARKCLAAGQVCQKKYEKTYVKHGLSCVKSGRRYVLTSNKLTF